MSKGQSLSTAEKLEICRLKREGSSIRYIYTKLNRSYGIVHRYLRDHGLPLSMQKKLICI
jgi:IS30 family transposase